MRTSVAGALILAGTALLVASAAILPAYWLGVLALVAVYAIASLAQNLLSGYVAIPSLGNVAFFGTSAYTAAALVTDAHAPVGVALLGGVCAAGVVGLAAGLPALRISGMHLAIMTLVLAFGAQELMRRWDETHNPAGLTVNDPHWLLQDRGLYVAAVVMAALSYVAVHNLLRSRTGRAFTALSENPHAAASVGINLTRYRLLAFVLSALLTGVAGVAYLYYARTVTPGAFPLGLSLAFLTMIVLGGTGSLGGSLLGALIVGLLPEFLRLFPREIGSLNLVQSVSAIYALLLLISLRFFPDGIWNGVAARAAAWRRSESAPDG